MLIDDEVYDGVLHSDSVKQTDVYVLDPNSNPVDSNGVPLFRLDKHTYIDAGGNRVIGFNIHLNRLGINYELQTLYVLSVTVSDNGILNSVANSGVLTTPSSSSKYQMTIQIQDVNDSPSEPFYTAAITEFASTDRLLLKNLIAVDPDQGDTHTWTLDSTSNAGDTFYVEQDSMTDVWKIAVNNQGYSCRVDFTGTLTPTSVCGTVDSDGDTVDANGDKITEAYCTQQGANVCTWVDRVSPTNHISSINGRNCANPTRNADGTALAGCTGGGLPGSYTPTKLRGGGKCRPSVASMQTGVAVDVSNAVVAGNLISYDSGSGTTTILRVQMDVPGGDFSTTEDFYVGGVLWSGMATTSCAQMTVKKPRTFCTGWWPR
jgi:hypothetical protein